MAINKVELCGVNTSRLPVLNAEEKETLLKKAREGDAAARERYIQGNLRLVSSASPTAVKTPTISFRSAVSA